MQLIQYLAQYKTVITLLCGNKAFINGKKKEITTFA